MAIPKSVNSSKNDFTAFEWAQTNIGGEVLRNNPSYLMGLARRQASSAKAVNELLGGAFIDQKYIAHLANTKALLGQ